MNDIPLTSEQLFVCDEKDLGVKLHLRYLTDEELQNQYSLLCREEYEYINKYEEQATKALPEGSKIEDIRIESYRLYTESDEYKTKNQFKRFGKYIDIFLADITGELKNVFPNGVCVDKNKMSNSLLYFSKRKIYEAIFENVDILTGLRHEEIKN